MRFLNYSMLVGVTLAVRAGIGIGCHNSVLRRAKNTIADYMRYTLQHAHLGDF